MSEATKNSSGRGNIVANLTLKREAAKPEVKLLSEAVNHLNGNKSREDERTLGKSRNRQEEVGSTNGRHAGLTKEKWEEDGLEDINNRGFGVKGNSLTTDSLRNVKSFQSPLESRGGGSLSENRFMEVVKEIDTLEDGHNSSRSLRENERKDSIVVHREARNSVSDSKLRELEHRIEKLEGELREAAGVEVSLYSVTAEHGSSANKVHAPARRLFRLYIHACKQKSQARKASAARSAVSGLVLVAKACGGDIPRYP